MKKLILLLALGLAACNESGGSASLSAPCEQVPPDTINNYQLTNINGEDLFIVDEDVNYLWYKAACEPYYFAVSKATNQIKESVGLIYLDSQCATPTHEIFDYPLHFSGDIYVFMFEGILYQYPLGHGYTTLDDYYYRTAGGVCEHRINQIVNARVIETLQTTVY